MYKFYLLLLAALGSLTPGNLKAQLTAYAGNDTTVCAGSEVILGGNPAATGGSPPYTYQWSPSTGLSCNNCPNPICTATTTTTYTMSVSGTGNAMATNTITVTVNPIPLLTLSASDTIVCPGQQVQLKANVNTTSCGITTSCVSPVITSGQIGTGTVLQTGYSTSYPSIFGNFQQSNRQQMLIKASELTQLPGGSVSLCGIGFQVGLFNSNAFLQNFTVRIGCTSQDSLTDWNNSLNTVLYSSYIQPIAGWNDFAFDSNYLWDGVSNLIIEICNNNPGLFGNQNNKAVCTSTAFPSYIYSASRTNECDTNFSPTVMYLRPNVRFGYCQSSQNTFAYNWLPSTGSNAVDLPHSALTTATITSPATFYVTAVADNGCSNTDSIKINTKPPSFFDSLYIQPNICPGAVSGIATVRLFSNDLVHYKIGTVNNSTSILSGSAWGADTIICQGLGGGNYFFQVSDSGCTSITKYFHINTVDSLLGSDLVGTTPACQTVANGYVRMHLTSIFDSIQYNLFSADTGSLLQSGKTASNTTVSLNALLADNYVVVLQDSLCADTEVINVPADNNTPLYTGNSFGVSCGSDSMVSGCVYLNGGYAPFTYKWSNNSLTGACPDNITPGTYSLTITDIYGCIFPFSGITVQQDTPIVIQMEANNKGFNTDTIILFIEGGTPAYTISWTDGSFIQGGPDTITFVYNQAGNNAVVVTDEYGCSSSINVVTSFITGLTALSSSSISIHPNPATDKLTVDNPGATIQSLEVFDPAGKAVLIKTGPAAGPGEVDVSTLSNGFYLLRLRTTTGQWHLPFVKQK